VAFVVAASFLLLNGLKLVASDEQVIEVFLSLAAGQTSESDLAEWFRRQTTSRQPSPPGNV
jgi:death-on-curing protein